MTSRWIPALAAALLLALAADEGSAQAVTLERDTDRPGGDYLSFDLSGPDPETCRSRCDGDARCQAYTYVPPGVQGPDARCWLKSSRPVATRSAGMVSGIRTSSPTAGTRDECGPGWLTDVVGGTLNGRFRQVCRRHDACYRERQASQRDCDARMTREMASICAGRPWYEKPSCQMHANVFTSFITSTYGGMSYSGAPEGRILEVSRKRIDDFWTDDEVTYCATVHNPSAITQEYDLRLYTTTRRLVDTEPDTHEFNVQSGGRKRACVGTNFSPDWEYQRPDVGGDHRPAGRHTRQLALLGRHGSCRLVEGSGPLGDQSCGEVVVFRRPQRAIGLRTMPGSFREGRPGPVWHLGAGDGPGDRGRPPMGGQRPTMQA